MPFVSTNFGNIQICFFTLLRLSLIIAIVLLHKTGNRCIYTILPLSTDHTETPKAPTEVKPLKPTDDVLENAISQTLGVFNDSENVEHTTNQSQNLESFEVPQMTHELATFSPVGNEAAIVAGPNVSPVANKTATVAAPLEVSLVANDTAIVAGSFKVFPVAEEMATVAGPSEVSKIWRS